MSGELSGTLRERAIIETRNDVRDQYAGAKGKYAYAGQAWVSVTPLVPASLEQAQSLSAMQRWQVIMRKREGIDQRVRLTWRGKYLSVRQVLSDPREPAHLILTCEEIR